MDDARVVRAAFRPVRQRDLDDGRLSNLIEAISTKRLGLDDVEADIIGKSYEYLIRKFAEGGGQSAGEFYTPPEVGTIMSRVLSPEPGMEVYDPCCGSGGLLIKCEIAMEAAAGSDACVKELLPLVPVCKADAWGDAPLHAAVGGPVEPIVGGTVGGTVGGNVGGAAVASGRLRCVLLLLEAMADVEQRGRGGARPAGRAACRAWAGGCRASGVVLAAGGGRRGGRGQRYRQGR